MIRLRRYDDRLIGKRSAQFITVVTDRNPWIYMIYTPLTVKAARIAYDAHHRQYDVCGMPYIFHPFTVAESMTDEYSTCVALLHDVVEDTDVTLEDLEGEFPEEVIEAVRLMTHDKDVDYEEYVTALKGNPIARAVKMADVEHNANESRNALATPGPGRYSRDDGPRPGPAFRPSVCIGSILRRVPGPEAG